MAVLAILSGGAVAAQVRGPGSPHVPVEPAEPAEPATVVRGATPRKLAQAAQAPTTTPTTTTTTAPTTTVPPAPRPPVDWFPLRRNLDGSEIKLGCTFRSHGSAFGYDCGGHHDRWALDLIAQTGSPVHPMRAGFARNVTGQPGGSGYGNLVRVDHGDGVETIYAHLSEVLVPAEGTFVDERSVIGRVGSTGSSSTPHLHVEKHIAGQSAPVDPGSLTACVGGTRVTYPEHRGPQSWLGLSWGAFTMFSDGTDCPDPATPRPTPAPRAPTAPAATATAASLAIPFFGTVGFVGAPSTRPG